MEVLGDRESIAGRGRAGDGRRAERYGYLLPQRSPYLDRQEASVWCQGFQIRLQVEDWMLYENEYGRKKRRSED